MYKVALINVPFASLKFPSLALTQLKSVLDSKLSFRVSVELLYLNHDFAHYMGTELYQYIAVDMEAPYNGLGDWFFRQAAFPELADNTEIYFQRYFPHRNEQNQILKRLIQEKREGLDQVLEGLIDQYKLNEADLVGFTSMFSQNVACFALARKIKERSPHIVIVMGGANCETPMGQEIVKNVEHIDFVFSGTAL
ncbi:MAG: RiPP maturation radical SAM protein 1, partial [Candidatus Aenigmarchaeota archaeon]|nr:RiPP maturation radical SAM protein 1 [Candidatus Aenigmarchaeota archaeon]